MLDVDKLARLASMAPAYTAAPVVPGTPFAACSRLYVGTGGTLTVTMAGGGTCAYKAADGAYLWVSATNVAGGGTAADIVAEYGPVRPA